MNNVKKSIGWCDYTINPIKGLCPMACPYCYARRMYKRFRWEPGIEFDNRAFSGIDRLLPSRIFVGSTMELFGSWVLNNEMDYIFRQCRNMPQHTFIFLTKQPENLIKWSPFPDNVWVGVSTTDYEMYVKARWHLSNIKAKVKFISIEPLLGRIADDNGFPLRPELLIYAGINWLIIGAQTPYSKKTAPRIEWVKEIVDAADKASIPVFLKNNLLPLFRATEKEILVLSWASGQDLKLRQEFPKGVTK